MHTLEISVYTIKNKFDAFLSNDLQSIKRKTESKKSEEDAVQQMIIKIWGNVKFKHKKVREGLLFNVWIAEKVEELSKSENVTITEIKGKSRAADMAKSRAKADFLRDVRLTPKANEQLKKLCEKLGLNKTEVINKLLEEQEQLSLL